MFCLSTVCLSLFILQFKVDEFCSVPKHSPSTSPRCTKMHQRHCSFW
uniref:Uncharacterized protein n=1 Tax=Rhizophora mucronata TaxID=61149 RepID=A0A2P2N4S3_RHIMU